MKPIFLAAILTATWPDGTTTHSPATTMPACLDATVAYVAGRASHPGHERERALTATCVPASDREAGFAPGWDTIKGYNDK